jgi:hypothetical protein
VIWERSFFENLYAETWLADNLYDAKHKKKYVNIPGQFKYKPEFFLKFINHGSLKK